MHTDGDIGLMHAHQANVVDLETFRRARQVQRHTSDSGESCHQFGNLGHAYVDLDRDGRLRYEWDCDDERQALFIARPLLLMGLELLQFYMHK
ncbi:hypothetical protein RVV79_003322 [Burkholderia contaminans]|nr:hypothetical protein [Burkholderia contaminans]